MFKSIMIVFALLVVTAVSAFAGDCCKSGESCCVPQSDCCKS